MTVILFGKKTKFFNYRTFLYSLLFSAFTTVAVSKALSVTGCKSLRKNLVVVAAAVLACTPLVPQVQVHRSAKIPETRYHESRHPRGSHLN
jgi:hypothetical protein